MYVCIGFFNVTDVFRFPIAVLYPSTVLPRPSLPLHPEFLPSSNLSLTVFNPIILFFHLLVHFLHFIPLMFSYFCFITYYHGFRLQHIFSAVNELFLQIFIENFTY